MTAASHVGNIVLDNVIILGDGTAATRHSVGTTAGAAGTSFTNTSGAPLAEHFSEYQGRVWAARGTAVMGTNTDMFYSTVGTATDWTTDSSSIRIPGAGRINSLYKVGGNLVPTKDSGLIFTFDGYNLLDNSNNFGPSSPYSIGSFADAKFFLNRRGVFQHLGGVPQLKSTPVEKQIFNNAGSGIAGTVFDNAPGVVHKYNYLLGVGTVTDDLTSYTIPDCVLRYDIRGDEWSNWKFAHRPYSFHSYRDRVGVDQLVFGDNGGQCYQLSGTATSDAGAAIEVQLMGVIHGNSLEEKDWRYLRGMFNPGNKAKIQIALSDTFTPRTLKWQDLGDARDGVVEYHFPNGSRGVFLFWKAYEFSDTSRFECLGFEYEAELVTHG